eukprot:TRINITY_DN2358_c0_g1_i1.p1 TRINITY_DN2358_c0_g1~~TRINITY_DN2358_c0_g1_i1.p1  ORF type:complete len:127 (+),score=5.98 TRINITY_DN2358_c0_g1_i1:82-462(+)
MFSWLLGKRKIDQVAPEPIDSPAPPPPPKKRFEESIKGHQEINSEIREEFKQLVQGATGCCWVKETGAFCGGSIVKKNSRHWRDWRLCKEHKRKVDDQMSRWDNFLQYVFQGDGFRHFDSWSEDKE